MRMEYLEFGSTPCVAPTGLGLLANSAHRFHGGLQCSVPVGAGFEDSARSIVSSVFLLCVLCDLCVEIRKVATRRSGISRARISWGLCGNRLPIGAYLLPGPSCRRRIWGQ